MLIASKNFSRTRKYMSKEASHWPCACCSFILTDTTVSRAPKLDKTEHLWLPHTVQLPYPRNNQRLLKRLLMNALLVKDKDCLHSQICTCHVPSVLFGWKFWYIDTLGTYQFWFEWLGFLNKVVIMSIVRQPDHPKVLWWLAKFALQMEKNINKRIVHTCGCLTLYTATFIKGTMTVWS